MITPLLFLQTQSSEARDHGGAAGLTVERADWTGKFSRFLSSAVPQWVRLAGVFLALLVVPVEARPQGTQPAAARDTITFSHSRHKALECAECHGPGATHGRLKFGAPDGCRSCHHGVAQKAACATCHAASPKPRDVSVTFNVVARKTAPVTRSLRFRHEQHGALDCAKCHNADADRTVDKNCVSCHADHHAPARDCTSCHADARAGHDRSAHDGCASCHTGARTAAFAFTRALCLTCHDKQRTHEPGGDCAACHAVASHGAAGGRN
jgi:hypothetical protein